MARFWDAHDLSEYWVQTRPHEFDVAYRIGVTYLAVKSSLAARLDEIARRRQVSPETLLNAWLRDRLWDEIAELDTSDEE